MKKGDLVWVITTAMSNRQTGDESRYWFGKGNTWTCELEKALRFKTFEDGMKHKETLALGEVVPYKIGTKYIQERFIHKISATKLATGNKWIVAYASTPEKAEKMLESLTKKHKKTHCFECESCPLDVMFSSEFPTVRGLRV